MPECGMAFHVDDLDRRILAELSADARLTQAALGARVGLSRSAVQERIKRLEREGVIRGYTLRLGQEVAPAIQAYLLIQDRGPSHERTLRALEGFPEVRCADSVAGGTDLVLQVQVERVEDLNRLRDDIARLPDVASTETWVVMAARFSR